MESGSTAGFGFNCRIPGTRESAIRPTACSRPIQAEKTTSLHDALVPVFGSGPGLRTNHHLAKCSSSPAAKVWMDAMNDMFTLFGFGSQRANCRRARRFQWSTVTPPAAARACEPALSALIWNQSCWPSTPRAQGCSGCTLTGRPLLLMPAR
jgi:hypothetical protein